VRRRRPGALPPSSCSPSDGARSSRSIRALVGAWSYESAEGGGCLLVCETTFPDGVEAEVPPPAEKRIALGVSLLDEVRIRHGANAYRLFPVDQHQGAVDADGAATIRAKMPAVVRLFAEGRLAKVDVEGSNPFSRSKKSEAQRPVRGAPSAGFFMLSTDAVHFAVH
jgi:hypothetical protein